MGLNKNLLLAAATAATGVNAATKTLAQLCTTANVQSFLPAADFWPGVTFDTTNLNVSTVTNSKVAENTLYLGGTISYCDIQAAYSHDGLNDQVLVRYWLPAPTAFENRFLATGGGGYAINSGTNTIPAGPLNGAAAGITDGGFGGYNVNADEVILVANGTLNRQTAYMFGYQAIHEMTVLGKELSRNFYSVAEDQKIYGYYLGCSEGGREGWSQVQRFYEDYDGASIGAPAFRYGHQQTNHLVSGVIEQTLGYYPSTCELNLLTNLTITACDPLDGKTDGVIARSDLCKLHFNLNSTIGTPYSCAAQPLRGVPAQNGTITAELVEVANAILDGLKDSEGRQVYLSYQPGNSWGDTATSYDSTTKSWTVSPSSLGGEWVTKFLELQDLDNLPSLEGITYDTLRDWMEYGWQTYEDSLQTTWPDLSDYQANGGKVIHWHGEQDNSVPTGSSVHYWESVRSVMYPELSYNDSTTSVQDFYRLFLIPGAGHCSPNTNEPNGPFPQNTLGQLITWVEKGVAPVTLNGTVQAGPNEGDAEQICAYPLRPYWSDSSSVDPECVYDQASIDTWQYTFDSFNLPVY